MKLLIGIDGGGTKTDFIACDMEGNLIKRIIKAGSNPIDIGMESALNLMIEGINELTYGYSENDILSIYAGLSGGTTGDNKERVNAKLREKFSRDIIINNHTDGLNALICGVGNNDGCVVISGTGTVGFGRRSGKVVQIGGYGYLIDRGGSGYDYGRDALYYSLCDLDKRGEKTLITDILEQKLGGIRKSIDHIYKKGKSYIASFAPAVFEAYKAGDKIAIRIVEENSCEIAKIFNALARYQEERVCDVVLAGSVFKDFKIIQPHLEHYLEHDFHYIFINMPPVCGAVIQAAINAGIVDLDQFKKKLNGGLQ